MEKAIDAEGLGVESGEGIKIVNFSLAIPIGLQDLSSPTRD